MSGPLVTWYWSCETCSEHGFIRYHRSVSALSVGIEVMHMHHVGHVTHVTRAPKPPAEQHAAAPVLVPRPARG